MNPPVTSFTAPGQIRVTSLHGVGAARCLWDAKRGGTVPKALTLDVTELARTCPSARFASVELGYVSSRYNATYVELLCIENVLKVK